MENEAPISLLKRLFRFINSVQVTLLVSSEYAAGVIYLFWGVIPQYVFLK